MRILKNTIGTLSNLCFPFTRLVSSSLNEKRQVNSRSRKMLQRCVIHAIFLSNGGTAYAVWLVRFASILMGSNQLSKPNAQKLTNVYWTASTSNFAVPIEPFRIYASKAYRDIIHPLYTILRSWDPNMWPRGQRILTQLLKLVCYDASALVMNQSLQKLVVVRPLRQIRTPLPFNFKL